MSNKPSKRKNDMQKTEESIIEMMRVERRSILPPPDELIAYEKLRPGITDIILKAFDEQSHHRMELERDVIHFGMANAKRGQIFAFIISLIVILGGFALILIGKDALGISSILTSLSVLLGVFIYGNKSKKDERIQKNAQPR